ncbi:MAG: PqqD family protein [Propionibacteriaceae bacterium]|nr:PqqD family protein [Propionibacteriaceae bacterium]
MKTFLWAPCAVLEHWDGCYLAPLPSGPLLVLSASAADVVACVSDGDDEEAIVGRLAESVGLQASVIREDVLQVLATLVSHNILLERHE